MFSTGEQFTHAAKANLEAQFAAASAFANKAFDNAAQVLALNIGTARDSIELTTAAAQKLLSAKNAQEFFDLSAAHMQPNAERLMSYGRSLAGIASSAQSELSKAAEAHLAATSTKIAELVDEAVKHAPAGSENAVALLKSALNNANAGYEQFSKSARQAADTLEDSVAKAARQFSAASEKAAGRAKK